MLIRIGHDVLAESARAAGVVHEARHVPAAVVDDHKDQTSHCLSEGIKGANPDLTRLDPYGYSV